MSTNYVRFNDLGQLAFLGYDGSKLALMKGDPNGTPVDIALQGKPVPGLEYGIDGIFAPGFNNRGTAIFQNGSGIFSDARGNGIELVVSGDTPCPARAPALHSTVSTHRSPA